ncbi:MAG: NAD(P)-dependent oxidoreductase [Defluviitaleaceae bacterium]|nr:NAD(P)-dependent oxidoreductase [Defluviitaleaceae bacterium]MCL2262785.1 NAD(P)-dependent oxidoreductase [Defluviitaleaceae bacterium]
MKIFITGGTGNIGQYVTKAFAEAGHECMVYTRTPGRVAGIAQLRGVTEVQGHISEFDKMEAAVKGCDIVIHIALGWGHEPLSMLMNDTRVSVFLMEAAEKAGVKQFIYTSSTAAIGPMPGNTNEITLRKPDDLYGATKAATEMFLLGFRKYYAKQGGHGTEVKMRRNIIRPGYTFSNPAFAGGASQSDKRFADIATAILQNKDIHLSEHDGTQFLSSEQIAQAYLKLAESDLNEEIIFAMGSVHTSWADIARMGLEYVPESATKLILSPQDPPTWRYETDKMQSLLGLKFDATNELREHIRWNIDRARQVLAGETLPSFTHEYSD